MSETQKQPILALWLMAALIVILPIEGTAALRNLLLLSTLIAFGVFVLKTKSIDQLAFPLKSLWGIYAALAFVGLLWAVNVPYSLNEIKHEIVFGAIFFWLAYNLYRRGDVLKWLIWPVLVGNVLLVGYCLVVWMIGDATSAEFKGPWRIGVGNFSTYLATILPLLVFCVVFSSRVFSRTAMLLTCFLVLCNLAAIYITQNRQVLISVFAQFAVVAVMLAPQLSKPKILLPILGGFFLVLSLFAVQTINRGYASSVAEASNVVNALESDGRLLRWRFAIDEALQHPLSGAGMGRETFKHVYPDHEITSSVFVHTHNMLVNRLVQLGVPGLMFFLVLFWAFPLLLWCKQNQSKMAAGLAVAGVAVAVGVFAKNMTDDFFMRELGYLYWVLGAALFGLQQSSKGNLKTDKFLIIRRDNIGDLLCTTPLMRALRQHYPSARIDALVNSYNAPVLANNPDLNHVYAYTKAKHRADGETVLGVHWRRIKLMWQLRQAQYDVVILAGDGNVDRQLGLARWIKAGQVIGLAPDDGKTRKGLDIVVPKLDNGHEVERTFSLLAPLGITGKPPEMVLVPDAKEVDRARAEINQVSGSPTIAIHVSARKIPQRWPIERFAELMHTIHANSGARFVLLWSPGDENNPLHPGDDQKAAALMALVQDLPVEVYPTHTLAELISVLSVCDQMICSDGGAMHIGAAIGLPIIALFGNSDADRWRPWCESYFVLQKPSRDVADVTVVEVLASQETLHKQIVRR